MYCVGYHHIHFRFRSPELQEARNALDARRRGQMDKTGEHSLAKALARCVPFIGEERLACEPRVMGYGGTSGSVPGGGCYVGSNPWCFLPIAGR